MAELNNFKHQFKIVQALLEKHHSDAEMPVERNQPFYNMVCVMLCL